MTVIRPSSISGINSITGFGGDINLFRADGTKADIPTVNNITAGVVTATKFVGPIEGGTINATSATITGNLGVGGVLTYEDVTNVDSVGVITARSGINVTSGSIGINTTGGNEKLNAFGAIRSSGSSANFNAGLEGTLLDYDIANRVSRVGHVNGASGSARSLAFLTGGGERLRVGPAGQLGIGGANYGTSGQVLTSQGSGSAVQWATPSGGLFSSYAVVTDEKSNGTDGGTFSNGAWRQRDINTEKFDPDGIVSVSSNEITLVAGTYYIEVAAPAYGTTRHMAKIYSISSPSQDWYGENAFAHGSHYATTHSFVRARIVCSGARTLGIAHRCETSRSNVGFGIACSFGNPETYTIVKIFKEA